MIIKKTNFFIKTPLNKKYPYYTFNKIKIKAL